MKLIGISVHFEHWNLGQYFGSDFGIFYTHAYTLTIIWLSRSANPSYLAMVEVYFPLQMERFTIITVQVGLQEMVGPFLTHEPINIKDRKQPKLDPIPCLTVVCSAQRRCSKRMSSS